jgi:plasmid stabilization system protein ParE
MFRIPCLNARFSIVCKEVHFTPEQEAQLARMASKAGTDAEHLVKGAALHLLENARFVEAVERGEDALKHGHYLTHEQVGERLRRFLEPYMEVRSSLPAAEDLESICNWISRDSPEAARQVARAIYDGCGQLKDFPNIGRPSTRMNGRRELTFSRLPISPYIRSRKTPSRSRGYFVERRIGLN